METPKTINHIIKNRRSIFPKMNNGKPVSKEIIEQVLENANYAPTHKLTEPWRFKVFREKGRDQLSDELVRIYDEIISKEKQTNKKREKIKTNPLKSDTVIAICMQRDPEDRIPEWEEIAAVSCAVQNMMLTCTAYEVGCYWSSPKSIYHLNEFLKLKEGEICLGFMYIGNYDSQEFSAKRTPIQDKIDWIIE